MDIGNSNIVFGLYQDKVLMHRFRISTRPLRTVDDYGLSLVQLVERKGLSVRDIEAVVIASVVPSLNETLDGVSRHYFNKKPLLVGRDLQVQMPLLIEYPQEVGLDRIVNAYAAYQKYHQALIVVDLGTATTFDVVNSQGEYLGGAIAPGLSVSNEALLSSLAHIKRVEIGRPQNVIGKNTKDAILSGVFFGYVGLVDGLIVRMQQELGYSVKVLATGGFSALLDGASLTIEEVDPDLTLSGLHLIYLARHQ